MWPPIPLLPNRFWVLNSPRQIAEACALASALNEKTKRRDVISLGRSQSSPLAEILVQRLAKPRIWPNRLIRFDTLALRGLTHLQPMDVVTGDLDSILIREGTYDVSSLARMRVILVDDGLSTLSFAKLIDKLNLRNIEIFSRYHSLISPNLLTKTHQPSFAPIRKPIQAGTLGVIGSPACEHFGVKVDAYAGHLAHVADLLGCSRIEYFPHRRESVKFENLSNWKFHPPGVGTLQVLSQQDVLPEVFYSAMSSSLVDVYLSVPNEVRFAFGRMPGFPTDSNARPALAAHGINTVEEIRSSYLSLNFLDLGTV